ncbi:Hypothetical predicted protein, partial [Scomber scombrus]
KEHAAKCFAALNANAVAAFNVSLLVNAQVPALGTALALAHIPAMRFHTKILGVGLSGEHEFGRCQETL